MFSCICKNRTPFESYISIDSNGDLLTTTINQVLGPKHIGKIIFSDNYSHSLENVY